jgi:hypothetical protein
MKKTASVLIAATAAAATWWGTSGGKKPKPQPVISADSAAKLAEADSFPVIVARDTLGRTSGEFRPNDGMILCGLSRNRYNGEVRIFIPADAPVGADEFLASVCERARVLYAAERSG